MNFCWVYRYKQAVRICDNKSKTEDKCLKIKIFTVNTNVYCREDYSERDLLVTLLKMVMKKIKIIGNAKLQAINENMH